MKNILVLFLIVIITACSINKTLTSNNEEKLEELRQEIALIVWENGEATPWYHNDHTAFIDTELNNIPVILKVVMEYSADSDQNGNILYKFSSIFVSAESEKNEVIHMAKKHATTKTIFMFWPVNYNKINWLTFEAFRDCKCLKKQNFKKEDEMIIALYEAILSGKFIKQ